MSDRPHGYGRYSNGACADGSGGGPCDVCRLAKAERVRTLRAARMLALEESRANGVRHVVSGITHGYAGYQEMKCRCWVCVTAKCEYDKKWRAGRVQFADG